jgi:hypothetical protein
VILVRKRKRFLREGEPVRRGGSPPHVSTSAEEADGVELLPLRPLPTVLGVLALGSFAAALVPSSRSARCVRRVFALGAVAVYAWVVV